MAHASLRSPNALARLAAERQTLARLSHPNVAQLYEAGTTPDGFPYFAMEFMPGDTLASTVYASAWAFVSGWPCSQVCEVQHAHLKGLIHRDLKPNNLLVGEICGQVVPKVIDFGIAKALGRSTDRERRVDRRSRDRHAVVHDARRPSAT
ncbi:MAG: protein kinase [Rhodanobacteraceae bacterium]|nr:protein kinase [Rhodanobacteraceae bacterium]